MHQTELSFLFLISFAGLPPIMLYSGKSFVTTALAATIVPFDIWRPTIIVTSWPIQTSSSIITGFDGL